MGAAPGVVSPEGGDDWRTEEAYGRAILSCEEEWHEGLVGEMGPEVVADVEHAYKAFLCAHGHYLSRHLSHVASASELLSLKRIVVYEREREFLFSLILPRSKTPVMRTVVQSDEWRPSSGMGRAVTSPVRHNPTLLYQKGRASYL